MKCGYIHIIAWVINIYWINMDITHTLNGINMDYKDIIINKYYVFNLSNSTFMGIIISISISFTKFWVE